MAADIYTVPVGKVAILKGVQIVNHQNAVLEADVYIKRAGTSFGFLQNVSVGALATVNVICFCVAEAGDVIGVFGGAANGVDFTVSGALLDV